MVVVEIACKSIANMASLQELAKQHSAFFDRLVEMVPAKYFFDSDKDAVQTRYMKKDARAEAKQVIKQQRKQSKRAKLDPEQATTALDVLKSKPIAEPSNKGEPESNMVPAPQLHLSGNRNLSRQELLDKLHKKIESMRQQNATKDKDSVATKAKEWKQQTIAKNVMEKQQRKKARVESGNHIEGAAATNQRKPSTNDLSNQVDELANFTFGRIDVESGRKTGAKHGKQPTKQELLAKAERQRKEVAESEATAEGKVKAAAVSWQAALARAAGDKVLDDPKLLRRSLKREKKTREKHAKAWQERQQAQQQAQQAKQRKRTDNLAARVQGKIEKKIERREKKLLRAGFEGRKAGFIGSKE